MKSLKYLGALQFVLAGLLIISAYRVQSALIQTLLAFTAGHLSREGYDWWVGKNLYRGTHEDDV